MSYEAKGRLAKVLDMEEKSGFLSREFVIKIESGQYPQLVKFQLVQDRCALIEKYAVGDAIKVHFDLRGREWEGRYFTNLNAWKIEGETQAQPAPLPDGAKLYGPQGQINPAPSQEAPKPSEDPIIRFYMPPYQGEIDDNLPF